MIRARTGEGRARAVARGVKMGRKPKLTPTSGARRSSAATKGGAVREIARTYNVSTQHDFTAQDMLGLSPWHDRNGRDLLLFRAGRFAGL